MDALRNRLAALEARWVEYGERRVQAVALDELSAERSGLWRKLHEPDVEKKELRQLRFEFSTRSLALVLNERCSGSNSFRLLDEALILGHPNARKLTLEVIKYLENSLVTRKTEFGNFQERHLEDVQRDVADLLLDLDVSPVHEMDTLPSIFVYSASVHNERPVVMRNAVTFWRSTQKWKSADFWYNDLGHRTVPVESGGAYTSTSFRQELMFMRDFVKEQLLAEPLRIGVKRSDPANYLAQHQIFEQIPSLLADIIEPEYASLGESGSSPIINLWLGPQNTETPLHRDPYHNLLAQVFGYKLVVLYNPEATAGLYPYADPVLHNASQIKLRQPDLDRFPNFASISGWTTLLSSGDMLYIPPNWWHYVISLSNSCSVSFWYN